MRKFTIVNIVLIGLLLLTPFAFCNNQIRVNELKTEGQTLQGRLNEYQQIVSNIQIRLIQIQAIITELESQDKSNEGISE